MEVPLCSFEGDSKEDLKINMKNITCDIENPRVIKEISSDTVINLDDVLRIPNNLDKEPLEKRNLLRTAADNTLNMRISSKYNTNGASFGKYHNDVLNNKFEQAEYTLKNIQSIYQKSEKDVREKITLKENSRGNYNITEDLLLKDKEYNQIKRNERQLNATFGQHYHAQGAMLQDIKNTVNLKPALNKKVEDDDVSDF
jgi:hypothetical protein